MNALEILKGDHDCLLILLQDARNAAMAFRELLLHSQIEEEIFYPALRDKNEALIEDSLEQHQRMERLVQEIERLDSTDDAAAELYAELQRVVGEHIRIEEVEIFSIARKVLGEDLERLGDRIRNRKDELAAGVSSRPGKAGPAVRSERAPGERVTREDIDLGRFESEGGRPSTPPPPQ